MGEAARRAYLKRTTPEQRFDHGLELSDAMVRAVIARARIPPDLPVEDRVKLEFKALRAAQRASE